MDFDNELIHPDQKSDLMWLIQQSLDGDLQAIEALFEIISPKFFQLASLFSPIPEKWEDFSREGLIFLLWNMKEYEEPDNFETWWVKKFLQYRREQEAENPNSMLKIPGLTQLLGDQVDQLLLEEIGLFTDEQIDLILAKPPDESTEGSLTKVDLRITEKFIFDVSTHAIIREYSNKRILTQDTETSILYRQIAHDAGKIFLQRRENVRRRLVLFQLVWGLLGIVFLAGAFQFAGNIFTAGGSVIQTTTVSNEIPGGLPTGINPQTTPTATPRPYERTQANGPSYSPDITADGRWIVYASEATNLVQGDTNGYADIFLYDRLNQETARLSMLPDGTQADGPSFGPSISPDGGWIAFVSFATNLVPNEKSSCADTGSVPRPCADVYLVDMSTGNILLVSQNGGSPGNRDSGLSPQGDAIAAKTAISDEGGFVAFFSYATNFGADPVYGGLFLYDKENSILSRVDNSYNGAGLDGSSSWPTISEAGDLLAFQSDASNLVPDDLNGFTDIFVYRVPTSDLVRLTSGASSTGADGSSVMPDLSSQGTLIVFRSDSTELVDANLHGLDQIYLHDLRTGDSSLISSGTTEVAADGSSNLPNLSGDGKFAVFISLASDINDALFNGTWDVFINDLVSNDIQLITRGLGGQATDGPSSFPKLSGDGLFVVFLSAATNIVPGDENGAADVFLFQRESASVQRINIP